MKKVILFDLDGTLLPQKLEDFIGAYFGLLVKKLAHMGLPASTEEEQKLLGGAVWSGTKAMMTNDGTKLNEERFFETFYAVTGYNLLSRKPEFDAFYENEFQAVEKVCGKNPLVKSTVSDLKERGYRVAIATNPFFPLIANRQRVKWAGLDLDDFEFCTCYENSSYCKPSLEYYKAILEHLEVDASECLMVGNDVREDMVARKLGIDVFLVTDCLINADNEDIDQFPHGDWNDFRVFMGL